MQEIRKNPFWSNDNVMNMLLRYDNWNNATHTPLNLSYKIYQYAYFLDNEKDAIDTSNDFDALIYILSDIFRVEIRETGPKGEYDIETKQGTYLTSKDWKYKDIIDTIKNSSHTPLNEKQNELFADWAEIGANKLRDTLKKLTMIKKNNPLSILKGFRKKVRILHNLLKIIRRKGVKKIKGKKVKNRKGAR